MRYEEFAPPPHLARYVHCLWVFEGQDSVEPQRIVPDGRCELILHWRGPYQERVEGEWRTQARAMFAGQLTRPLHLLRREPAGLVAVRFRAAGARAYLHRPLTEITDTWVAVTDAPDVSRAASEAARLQMAVDHVTARLDPSLYDDKVAAAVAELRASEGRAPLDDLCATAGLSPRTLQRRFAEAVGVSPRMLASVIRFRRVFAALHEPGVTSWTEAAQAAGYFDHPQMARDFRRFLGCSPSEFLRAERGLAVSLAEVS
jgi:AraC-like DNA-binding protein